MNSLTQFHGIEVEVIDQNSEGATIRAMYGQPFQDANGSDTNTLTVSPLELSEVSDQPGAFHVAIYA